MTITRIETQNFEHSHLEDEIYPRMPDEQGDEEHNDSGIKSEDVAKRHEGQASLAELLSDGVADGQLLYQWTKQLELWCLAFLGTNVADIKIEIELLEPFLLVPPEALHPLPQLHASVQLALFPSQGHPKMDVTVVVGNSALARMAEETCPKDYQDDVNAPDGIETDGYGDVDAEEPAHASEAVKDTPYERSLPRHACQLSVGTVVPVRPNQQQHADDVVAEVVVGKEEGGSTAYDDAHQRHGYGMNMQTTEELRPQIAWGSRGIEFKVALYVP